MSSRKKNHPHRNLNRIKQNRIEHKLNFFRRIENICALVGGQKYYSIIPKEELENIYSKRGLPPTVIPDPKSNIQTSAIKEIRFGISVLTRYREIKINEAGDTLSIFELITIGIMFLSYLTGLQDDEYANAAEVKKLLRNFRPYEEIFGDTYRDLHLCMLASGYEQSCLDGKIYRLKHEFEVSERPTIGIENIIRVYAHIPEQVHLCINDKSRPAFRVCWWEGSQEIKYYSVSYKKLGIDGGDTGSMMEIYIQSHALQRLKERLDCLKPMFANVHLIYSLEDMRIHKEKDGTYFIEYSLNNIKVGYLVANILDNKLVIRTFLFITQNGTPEGDKLSELYGLAKLDKSYIALDKLSTYVLTDLCVNNNLRNMFDEAGCQYLLDIYTDKGIKSYCTSEKNCSMAEDIISFLGFDNNKSPKFSVPNRGEFINMYKTSTQPSAF
jgi:hypothetical protein